MKQDEARIERIYALFDEYRQGIRRRVAAA